LNRKTIQYGKRVIELDFKKDSINITVLRESDHPSGFDLITELIIKTRDQ
tara:strand:- start:82 stop:231 length:150 start_codon:yes stop_codon:yes gene_type:complete